MSGIANLDNLLRLLDDDSEVVRKAVQEKLASMRPDLPLHLSRLERPLPVQEDRLGSRMPHPCLLNTFDPADE